MPQPHPDAVAGAKVYDAFHVPALFAEWAPRVLAAADVRPGHRVLDVACGTGVLARAARDEVGAEGRVVGVDPDPGMLQVAREMDDGVEWKEGRAGELPVDDAAFDRVVSQFGMMFFPDPEAAVREMVRALKPGGRFAIAVWDSLENSRPYHIAVELLDRMAGPAAADALRAPFVLGDADALARRLSDAAGTPITVSTVVGRGRFPSIRSMVEADLRGWLPVMGVHLTEEQIEKILGAAEDELAEFRLDDGRVEFDSPAHILVGRRTG